MLTELSVDTCDVFHEQLKCWRTNSSPQLPIIRFGFRIGNGLRQFGLRLILLGSMSELRNNKSLNRPRGAE